MAKNSLGRVNNLFALIRFILLSVPFTLITIGNCSVWLIVKVFRFILTAVQIVIALVRALIYLLVKILHAAFSFIAAIIVSVRTLILSMLRILPKRVASTSPRPVKRPIRGKIYRDSLKARASRNILWFVAGITASVLFIFLPYQVYQTLRSLPNPILLTNRAYPATTKIFDRHGKLLYEFYADQNRTPVSLKQIPQVVKQATIAIEDRDFYRHIGFSIRGITRAAVETLVYKHLQGGSTITQQLIKNALLTPEPTLSRKIKELLLSFWAERLYTKDQILEMYFNQVPYGGTYWGIASASMGYFGKPVSQLSLAESAFLAGLPAAPTFYSPFNGDYKLAKKRQVEVLRRMKEDGYIAEKQFQEAENEELTFASQSVPIKAPHFVMYIKELLTNRYGLRMVEQGGLLVTTSLDLELQDMAEKILANELDKLTGLHVGNGGIIITNPKTGEILSMVGSKNYFDNEAQGNVNVTLSLRQPGSSIKVVTYAAALQQGFTAASILDDSPIIYAADGQAPYIPVNYDGAYHGKVPLRFALGNSYNIPAVKVLSRIGLDTMITQAKKMGIRSWTNTSGFGLSLTLGGGEVTMLDMASVYNTLANGGKRADLHPILTVSTVQGEALEEKRPPIEYQAVPEEVAFILSDILSDNQARSAAFGPNSTLVIPGKTVAVKTGTSNDKRDNWTIGYTPSFVVTVWVGNNDGSPMNPLLTSGITGAAPIWQQVMLRLLGNKPDEKFRQPANVIAVNCFYGRAEYFIKGTQPAGGCPVIFPPLPPSSPTPFLKPIR